MKTLTRKKLDELAMALPVLGKDRQRGYVGGGSGTETDPYTVSEYNYMCFHNTWSGGYVVGLGYTLEASWCTGNSGSTGGTGNTGSACGNTGGTGNTGGGYNATSSCFAVQLATDYIGINETQHPEIIEEWQRNQIGNLGYSISASDTSWCAIFVAEVYHEVGLSHPAGAQARVDSWKNWGQGVTDPQPGDIAIFNKSGESHIGIVSEVNGDSVKVICGNTGNAVREVTRTIDSLEIRRAL